MGNIDKYILSENMVKVIKSVCGEVIAKIQSRREMFDQFLMKKDIKQGDSLSPLLFMIIIDTLIKNTRNRKPNAI